MPRFRAAPGPALACRTTWKRGVLLRILLQNGRGCVGGAVVHTDDLQVGEGLPRHAVQALPQMGLDVVDWDDHGNLRHLTTPPSQPP